MNPSLKTGTPSGPVADVAEQLSGLQALRDRYYAGLAEHRSQSALRRFIDGGRAYEYMLICVIRRLTYQIHHLTIDSL